MNFLFGAAAGGLVVGLFLTLRPNPTPTDLADGAFLIFAGILCMIAGAIWAVVA